LFITGYKRLAEGDGFFSDGGLISWLQAAAAAAAGCVSPPEQLSALRTLYIGFRKAKLKEN
jgi:hypothetical protein